MNSNKGDYDKIVNETIDDLNASHSFDGTPMEKEAKDVVKSSFQSKWFLVLCLLLLFNIGLTIYFNTTSSTSTISPEDAATLIAETSGDADDVAQEFMAEEVLKTNRHQAEITKERLLSIVDHIRENSNEKN